MYIPAHFREERIPVLHEGMRQIGFASLVTCSADGMEASHLPMLIEPKPVPLGTLYGHVARTNPQWQRVRPDIEAMAIFMGPNSYVSSSFYPSKRESGKVVPTWNYLAIHAYGSISFYDDAAALRAHVGKLTDTYEAERASPWGIDDAPKDYVEKMLGAIVGFKLVITRLEGKWKMSQNRSHQDAAGVREGLMHEGAPQKEVAEIMAKLEQR